MTNRSTRLREARLASGFGSAAAAARRIGVPASTYAAHENGQNDYGPDEAVLYARIFKADPVFLLTGGAAAGLLEDNSGEDLRAHTRTLNDGLQVAGVVEAGAFREVNVYAQDEPRRLSIGKDTRFLHETQYAWEVRGDSADLAGIREGMYVIGVMYGDWLERMSEFPHGRFVIVERTRFEGAEREITIKQAKFFKGRVELHPKSSNPVHKPIMMPINENPDDTAENQIRAVVLAALTMF